VILVVDASVAVQWFVEEQGRADALAVLRCNADVVVPDLFFAEFANVLWKKSRKGEVAMQQAAQAISCVNRFIGQVMKSADLIERAFQWAQKLDHSVYDCLYLTCAEVHGSKFVTADRHFVRKLQGNKLDYLVMPIAQASELLEGRGRNVKITQADIERILKLHRRFEETLTYIVENVEEKSGRWTTVNSTALKPAFDSPAYRRLLDALNALSTDDLCDLVALAWLGRGYDGHDWDRLRQQSQAMLGGRPSDHLPYVTSLLGYVEPGLEKIEAPQGQA
jgi:predicted nucleic acid-binding protein